jgi:hypothetical protein
MSAVAQPIDAGTEVAVAAPHAVAAPAAERSIAAETAETNRWMFWFGLPAVFAAISVALALGKGWEFMIGFAIFFIVTDILVLVWLAMSSDTNAEIEPAYASGH